MNGAPTNRLWKCVANAALALALAFPYLSGLAPLFHGASSDCGMSCCKKGERCCRRGKGGAEDKLAYWNASASCVKGCGRFPGAQASPFATAAAALAISGPAASRGVLDSYGELRPVPSECDFALFAKPPPAL
jgi:hypothetical protein